MTQYQPLVEQHADLDEMATELPRKNQKQNDRNFRMEIVLGVSLEINKFDKNLYKRTFLRLYRRTLFSLGRISLFSHENK